MDVLVQGACPRCGAPRLGAARRGLNTLWCTSTSHTRDSDFGGHQAAKSHLPGPRSKGKEQGAWRGE